MREYRIRSDFLYEFTMLSPTKEILKKLQTKCIIIE